MKNVKTMFGAMTLALLLSNATLAGDVSTPGYVPPPPPAPLQSEPNDTDDLDSLDLATEFLIAALSAYYQ